MNGGITLSFTARNIDEAIEEALDRWRKIINDPTVTELPWSAHFLITDEAPELAMATDYVLAVKVHIEFDRTMLEKRGTRESGPATTVTAAT